MSSSGEAKPQREQHIKEVSLTMPGIVEKVVTMAGDSTKAQIVVKGGDDLYREIRIPNVFCDGNGGNVSLPEGSEVEITIKLKRSAI